MLLMRSAGDWYVLDVNYFTVPHEHPGVGQMLVDAVCMAATSWQAGEHGSLQTPLQFVS